LLLCFIFHWTAAASLFISVSDTRLNAYFTQSLSPEVCKFGSS
jgi:hypothetical protein